MSLTVSSVLLIPQVCQAAVSETDELVSSEVSEVIALSPSPSSELPGIALGETVAEILATSSLPKVLSGLSKEPSPTLETSIPSTELLSQNSNIIQTPPDEGLPTLRLQPTTPDEKPFSPQNLQQPAAFRFFPGITVLTPSAYGKSWGSMGVGVGFQSRTRFTDTADAALGVSVGFGDARKAVGLDVGTTLYDLSDFKLGAFSFKLHRLLPQDFAIAVGVNNVFLGTRNDNGTSASPFGVVTKRVQLNSNLDAPFSQMFLNLGIGGGNFQSEANVLNNSNSVGVFGGVAISVIPPMRLIAEWSQDLTLGLSIAPFRKIPLIITPAVSDITGNAGDGPRFTVGIGYGIRF